MSYSLGNNNRLLFPTNGSKCPFLRVLSIVHQNLQPYVNQMITYCPSFTRSFSTTTKENKHFLRNHTHNKKPYSTLYDNACSISEDNHQTTTNSTTIQAFHYEHKFKEKIEQIKSEGRYRHFAHIERQCGDFPYATYHPTGNSTDSNNARTVINWCSNDYLCMGQNPKVLEKMKQALMENGAGAGGTRNISGTNPLHRQAEKELADLHHKENGLLFTSCYVANDSVLSTLSKIFPDIVMISDEYNHASMIQGIIHSRAEKYVYKHNDVKNLEKILSKIDINRPKIIIFESVNSMEGTIAPMHDICDLADKYKAMTFCDEVHAVGLYGEHGAGIAERDMCLDRITMITGTLAKGYGLMGGYLVSKSDIIDAMRSMASGFIFSTALPPVLVSGIIESIKHLKYSSIERQQMYQNVKNLRKRLKEENIPVLDAPSHIVPIIIGDAEKCKEVTDLLLNKHGIYVQPINYPTVSKGTERLRVTCTPKHTMVMREHFVQALNNVLSIAGVNKCQ